MTRRNLAWTFTAMLAATGTVWAGPPTSSPYYTDPQNTQVQDATSETIGQVNMITCVMTSMRPDALVNQGPYVALVDQNKCDASKQSSTSSSTDSSGGSQAPNYMTAIVNSTRASNSDPMLVSAWISIDQNGTPVTIYAHINASAAPTTSDPYGSFRLDYCGKAQGAGGCAMNGFMQAGGGTLSYYELDNGGGGGGGGTQTTALQLSSVGTSTGAGSVNVLRSQGMQNQSETFDFAYDANYYLRHDGATSSYQCFSRDATDPGTGVSVWSYGLYDSTSGVEITRNSGFPIQYTSNGTAYQGYVGYYGLSNQPGAPAPADGQSVEKIDYQGGHASTTNYAVVSKGGRLMRYTRQQTTLKAIDQVSFNAFVGDATGSGLPASNTQYAMNWDETSQAFTVTGQMQCGQNGCQAQNFASAISVPASFWSAMGLQGWSQSLGGGNIFIQLNAAGAPLDTTTVIYYNQDLVYPDDASLPATLYCVNNCPTAATLQSYFTQSGTAVASPYGNSYNQWQPSSALVAYGLSGNVLTGGDGSGNPVVYTDANAYQQFPMYQNGVGSGRMVADPSLAQCGTDSNNAPLYCDWTMNTAGVYYQWQTGPNSWDQFTAVKDGTGAFVHFDAPLNVKFTVPANGSGSLPYGNYAGSTLILQYGGFGNLWGIPGNCVSPITNQTVDCNTANARYVPAFAIPYDPSANPQQGVVTASSNGTATTYLVKWLNREIRFAQKPLSTCTNDSLSTSSATLPGSSGLQDPSNSSSSVYIGTAPALTSAPRVIQGQVMY